MQAIGLILLFLTGFLVIKRISTEFTLTECLGFAFPLGLGLITFLMMLMDWIGISLSSTTNLTATILLLAIAIAINFSRRRSLIKSFKPQWDFKWMNLVWLLLLVLIVYAEYSNFVKTLYYPTYDRDSMAGFDTIGFVAAQEHTYKGMSIFDGSYFPRIHAAGSYITYMPMIQLAYAYVYSLGAETSKAIPALFYLSFLFGFYGMTKRATCRTAAILSTFCMMISPEMFSFSSLSNTNVMHACAASAGIIYLCLWFKNSERRDLLLGCALLALNCWIRTEGIVFVVAALLLVLIKVYRTKQLRRLLLPAAALLPIVIFMIYAVTNGLTAESVVIAHPFWDPFKAQAIAGGAVFLIAVSHYYGYTFLLLLVAAVADIKFAIKERDGLPALFAIVLTTLLYFLILYHINYVWDSLDNVINYSAKRFLFCMVPIAWFYIVTNKMVSNLLQKMENALTFCR